MTRFFKIVLFIIIGLVLLLTLVVFFLKINIFNNIPFVMKKDLFLNIKPVISEEKIEIVARFENKKNTPVKILYDFVDIGSAEKDSLKLRIFDSNNKEIKAADSRSVMGMPSGPLYIQPGNIKEIKPGDIFEFNIFRLALTSGKYIAFGPPYLSWNLREQKGKEISVDLEYFVNKELLKVNDSSNLLSDVFIGPIKSNSIKIKLP